MSEQVVKFVLSLQTALGSFVFDGEREADSPEGWYNRAYFCTRCGTVWATWSIPGDRPYYAIHRSCEHHRAYASERPGSLLVNVREDLAMLPPELLVREFQLTEEI